MKLFIKGRDQPVAQGHMDEFGNVIIRVDFELNLAGWAELQISHLDFQKMKQEKNGPKRNHETPA